MRRRKFIKINSLALGAILVPNFPKFGYEITQNDLLGKSKRQLYGQSYQLLKEASASFDKLAKEAKKEGFRIFAASSYRSFEHQKRIWNNKYKKFTQQGLSPKESILKIVEYSTIPGTSRHHWATEVDVIDLSKTTPENPLSAEHFTGKGVYADLKKWLDEKAEGFGFYEVYTNVPKRKGFKYEPWHFSYRPQSCNMLTRYKQLNFPEIMRGLDIEGSQYFTSAFLEKYYKENILDINPELLP